MTGLNAVCPSTVSTTLHNSEVHEAVCTTEFYTEYICGLIYRPVLC